MFSWVTLKKISKILLFVSIVLIAAFIGCLAYSVYNPEFSFVETISTISSFFVACLTVIYVYTSSNQMDLMKQQSKQMQQAQRLSEQPILNLESTKFEIERPRFYYTPPQEKYSYLSRYFSFVQINNISNYPAVFIDVNAQLIIEENGNQMSLGTTSKRVNVIAANSVSEQINIMFTGDSKTKIMSALRSSSTAGLPKLRISVYYKSLSGANYMLTHTYWLDIADNNEESAKILKNWHAFTTALPASASSQLERSFENYPAQTFSVSYTPYSDSVTTPEEQAQHEEEFFEANPDLYKQAGADNSIMPKGEDPGDGAINISTGNMFTTGSIYWDSQQTGARLQAIANIAMTLWGGTTGTVISIIMDSLTILGITGTVDMSSAGEVKVGHSISYINKAGEFYYNRTWKTAVLTQQRKFFEHRYFLATVNGVTRQETVDKTPENGFSAYKVDYSTHFNDNSFISQKSRELYLKMVQTGAFGMYDERWV